MPTLIVPAAAAGAAAACVGAAAAAGAYVAGACGAVVGAEDDVAGFVGAGAVELGLDVEQAGNSKAIAAATSPARVKSLLMSKPPDALGSPRPRAGFGG